MDNSWHLQLQHVLEYDNYNNDAIDVVIRQKRPNYYYKTMASSKIK